MAETTGRVMRALSCFERSAVSSATRHASWRCTPCLHVRLRAARPAPGEPLLDRRRRAAVRGAAEAASGGILRLGGLPGAVGADARAGARARVRAPRLPPQGDDAAVEHGG